MTRSVQIEGAEIGYTILGEGTGKPPLVFVHGYSLRSTGDIYRELFAGLAATFTVYALDIRGHGASGGVEGWSLERVADDVASFCDHLGLNTPVYVGHSIGGFIGLLCAIRHPQRFYAMALITTAPASGGAFNPPETSAGLIRDGRDADLMARFFAPMYVTGPDEELQRAVAAVTVVDPRVHQAFFEAFPALVLTDDVAEIDIPILVLNGGRDVVVPLKEQHETALRLRRAKEVTVSVEGHMLPVEAPSLAVRELVTFFDFDAPVLIAASLS